VCEQLTSRVDRTKWYGGGAWPNLRGGRPRAKWRGLIALWLGESSRRDQRARAGCWRSTQRRSTNDLSCRHLPIQSGAFERRTELGAGPPVSSKPRPTFRALILLFSREWNPGLPRISSSTTAKTAEIDGRRLTQADGVGPETVLHPIRSAVNARSGCLFWGQVIDEAPMRG